MKRLTNIILSAMLFSAALSAQPKPFDQTWTRGPQWLEDAVIYQVYPSSYKDSDGNGIGDLKGILSSLDYIQSLGVNAIWLNPIFESGWIDGGYDVIDFYKVDPRFGTNDDLVTLAGEAHKRGLYLMLDLVAGHTSDRHPWFRQSTEGANFRYSDYYIWSDRLPDKKAEKDLAKMLKDPNFMQNTTGKWMSSDAPRGKYYMKNFYACQPALNYGFAHPDPSHPWEQGMDAPGPRAVLAEMMNIIDFWYSRGVDGFRVDLANSLVKGDTDKEAVLTLWRKVRSWMDRTWPDHVLMAEWGDPVYCLASGFNVDMDLHRMRATAPCRQMYFDMKHQSDGGCYFSIDGGAPATYDLYGNPWPEKTINRGEGASDYLRKYYDNLEKCFAATEGQGYIATITGNHDHLRLNTGRRNTPAQLKVMMTWVMTMPLPILYYGDEIGIKSLVDLPSVEGANHNGKERAGARTPMQWDSSANAGFSSCAPDRIYLPVCPEWTPEFSYPKYLKWKEEGCRKPVAGGAITVESQQNDPSSLLNFTRSLIALRHSTKAFWATSEWKPVRLEQPYPMVYTRSDGVDTYVIILNPTGSTQKAVLPFTLNSSPVKSEGKVKAGKKGSLSTGPTSLAIYKL